MSRGDRIRTAWPWWLALLVAVVLLGPALLPGYVLLGDMVFVPRQPMKAAWWGLDGSVPRAVPMDGLVAALSVVLPGQVLQKAALLGALVLAGAGAASLCRAYGTLARAAALLVAMWNPWVHERLLIGQWSIVLGYALLPWVVLAARDAVSAAGSPAPRRARGRLVALLVAAAVCTPSSGLMAAGAAVVVLVLRRSWPTLGVAALAAVAGNAVWVVPALRVAGGVGVDEGSFSAFAARAESSAGVLASLVSLGGIWKTSVVPDARTSATLVLVSAVVAVVCLVALVRTPDRTGVRGPLLVLGAIGLLVAAVPAWAPAGDALDALSVRVPGVALLRDGHRFLAPLALPLAVGAAALTQALLDRARSRAGLGAVAPGLLAALVLGAPAVTSPGLAAGASGALEPVTYPEGWDRAAQVLAEQAAPGEVTVVLPWTGSYRGFGWNDYRAVLDPAPRYLPGEVWIDDRVLLSDRVLASEDARLRAVGEALATDDASLAAARLRELGVGWVLVHAEHRVRVVPAGEVLVDQDGLTLLRLAPDPLA